jgi:hypothetical protein
MHIHTCICIYIQDEIRQLLSVAKFAATQPMYGRFAKNVPTPVWERVSALALYVCMYTDVHVYEYQILFKKKVKVHVLYVRM